MSSGLLASRLFPFVVELEVEVTLRYILEDYSLGTQLHLTAIIQRDRRIESFCEKKKSLGEVVVGVGGGGKYRCLYPQKLLQ